MVKCFYCGTINERKTDICCSCRRKMEWSHFFKALLKPAVAPVERELMQEPSGLVGAGSAPARLGL